MSNSIPTLPQVAVLVDTSTDWGRRLIVGISSYAQKHTSWALQVEPRGREDAMNLPKDWDGQGVIARISNKKIAKELLDHAIPIVNVSGIEIQGYTFPRVTTDYTAVAELAVDHFRSRGFKRFAYIGPLKHNYVRDHADSFEKCVAGHGEEMERFDYAYESLASERWRRQRQRLGAWLMTMEKPLAVFSWGTAASSQLLDICRYHRIVVPDEVAVLAGDSDDVISQTTSPSLSGILCPSAQIGYRAAQRLDLMFKGEADDLKDDRILPIEIVTRGSTDCLAIEDAELAKAVKFMRDRACGKLTVEEVANFVPMTRRSLERKFSDWLGRTPLEEIKRLRLARVKELLATTDLPISKVADASGFGTPEYMAAIFKKATGSTPLRYRSTTRAR